MYNNNNNNNNNTSAAISQLMITCYVQHVACSEALQAYNPVSCKDIRVSNSLWFVDSTAEYISALDGNVSVSGIHSCGLRCVTVLIGVYDLASGCPLFGCVNQPFVRFDPQSNKYAIQYMSSIVFTCVQ